jgi:glycosyltransferase involved in cell wall biosynthesis
MKIIEFSSTDRNGAGIAALRYHKLLQSMGHECTLYVSQKHLDDPSVLEINYFLNERNIPDLKRNIKYHIRKTPFLKKIKQRIFPPHKTSNNNILTALSTYSYYNFDEIRTQPNLHLLSKVDFDSVDIIFIYWLGNFINTSDIKYLYEKTNARIIFAMMDMEPITGGCHYFWDCNNFYTNCFNCPALPHDKQEFSHVQLTTRAQNVAYMNAEIFSSSLEDLQIAHNGVVKFQKYWHLYYPIDENIFYPRKDNRNTKIYLYSNAHEHRNPRKGFWLLMQILFFIDKKLTSRKIVLLCLDKSLFSAYKFKNIEFEEFSFCTNLNDLADLYRRSDIFLCTSVEDAAPQMLAEALMCGLPTVSFNIATANQFISNGVEGYIVNRYDTVSFAEKVIDLITQITIGKIRSQNKQIHEKMVKICGIDAVKQQLNNILSKKTKMDIS